MDAEQTYSSDVAFTSTVKAIQARRGSRKAYAHREQAGAWPTRITPDLAAFIAEQTSVVSRDRNKNDSATSAPWRAAAIPRRNDRFRRFRRQSPIHHARQSRRRSESVSLPHRLHAPPPDKNLGRGARRRRRCGARRKADAGELQGAAGAGDRVCRRGLGFELRATHSAAFRGGRRRRRIDAARPAHRGAGGRGQEIARNARSY